MILQNSMVLPEFSWSEKKTLYFEISMKYVAMHINYHGTGLVYSNPENVESFEKTYNITLWLLPNDGACPGKCKYLAIAN